MHNFWAKTQDEKHLDRIVSVPKCQHITRNCSSIHIYIVDRHEAQTKENKDSIEGQNMVAAIDVGTFGCRILIGSMSKVVSRWSQTIRLQVSPAGQLLEESKARLFKSLVQCNELMSKFNVKQYKCVGTAACRAIKNQEQFVAEVKEKTGVDLQIISPRSEIRFACIGASSVFSKKKSSAKLVFDIGGGSTDIGLFYYRRTLSPQCIGHLSVPHGILTPDRNSEQESKITNHLTQIVTKLLKQAKIDNPEKDLQVISTSGPLTSIVTLHKGLRGYHGHQIHGSSITAQEALDWIQTLTDTPKEDFLTKYGISAEITNGFAMLAGIIRALPPGIEISVSSTGVRHGVLQCIVNWIKRKTNKTLTINGM